MTHHARVAPKPCPSSSPDPIAGQLTLPFSASSITAPVPAALGRTFTHMTNSSDPYTDRDAEGEAENSEGDPDTEEVEGSGRMKETAAHIKARCRKKAAAVSTASGAAKIGRGTAARARATTGAPSTTQKMADRADKAERKPTAKEMVDSGEGSTHAHNGRGYTEAEVSCGPRVLRVG